MYVILGICCILSVFQICLQIRNHVELHCVRIIELADEIFFELEISFKLQYHSLATLPVSLKAFDLLF